MALSQHFVAPQEYYNQFTPGVEITPDDKVIDDFICRVETDKKSFFKNKHYYLLMFMENVLSRADLDQNTKTHLLIRLLRGLRDRSLNPLSFIPRNSQLFNICTTALYEAYNSQILNTAEYTYFLSSALIHCLSEAQNKQELIVDLILQMKRINNFSPLCFIIYNYASSNMMKITFNILMNAFCNQRLARKDFYELLIAEDLYGITPLHIAIKSNKNAVNTCLNAMDKIFSLEQKNNFNLPTQKDSYLEWIVFHGNIHILQKYAGYLRKTNDKFALDILLAQFKNLRKTQPYEYEIRHPIIQFLNLLHGYSTENPTQILDTLRSRRRISPYLYLYKWSVVAAPRSNPKWGIEPTPEVSQPEYVFSYEEEKKITAYNIKLEEDESKHSMSFIL